MNENPTNKATVDDEVTEVSIDAETAPTKEPATALSPLQIAEQERDEFKDKYLRTYAEFDNFRKRIAKEKAELVKFGNEKLLREILALKDHLDRALDANATPDLKSLREGMSLINREFDKVMTHAQVQTIDAVGKPFDPQLHEALAEEESDQAPGTVLSVFQQGYIYHGRLLRPARVVVAKAKTAGAAPAETPDLRKS